MFFKPVLDLFDPPSVGTWSKRKMHSKHCLGVLWERPHKTRQRTFYLRCVLFPGLFSDVISCLLWHLYSISSWNCYWLEKHSYRTHSGQCALNLDISLCLAYAFPVISYRISRQLYLNWSILRKFWGRAALLTFNMCLLMFIFMFFWTQTWVLESLLLFVCFIPV